MKKLALFLLLLVACTPVAQPTAVLTPSAIPTISSTSTVAPVITASDTLTAAAMPIPTLTSTPVPPLVAHQWSQSDPLITLDIYGGDGGCNFVGTLPARFTLMPDNSLYMLEGIGSTDFLDLKTTALSRGNTCKLLNSIDQAGFLDYDPRTYIHDPSRWGAMIAGAGHTAISVQAWRSNAIDLYGVAAFIYFQDYHERTEGSCLPCTHLDGFPIILPALRNTYKLLSGYRPEGLRTYEPVRIGVWIAPGVDSDKWDVVNWPLKSPSVADLASLPADPNGAPVAILTGTKAAAVEKMFNQKINDCGMVVMNGFNIYRVFARPLLPNEYPSEPLQQFSLSCSPSDGQLQLP